MSFAGNQFFKHDLMRRYVYYFGHLFDSMVVQRYDSAGTRIQSIQVPIAYSPKEKMLVRVREEPDLDAGRVAMQLPRIGFEMTSMAYSAQRKLNTLNRYVKVVDTDEQKLNMQYQSIPYDLTFSLYIMVKNAYDGVQLLEQIVPFFTPDWTATINTIPSMDITADIPITLQSVVTEDVYEGDFDTRRALIWTLDFEMKAQFYGPVKTSDIIKKTIVDMYVPTLNTTAGGTSNTVIADSEIGTTAREHRLTTTPGLTASGVATANSTRSVAYTTIKASDPYGFAQDLDFFQDGKKRNPVNGGDEPL
mgnify:CR=1 FL=1|jgi:hypothetical protein